MIDLRISWLLVFLWAPCLAVAVDSNSNEQSLEPEVTILQTERETIYEYRINGKLTLVKIVPVAGPPYYLVDTDSDGIPDMLQNDINAIGVQQWLLFRW